MNRSLTITETLIDYIWQVGVREHAVLAKCRRETEALGRMAVMQISPEQGAFMALLVQLIQAQRTLEIGTFTGYSSLSVALAMGDKGRVTCCDLNEDYIARARRYWQEAGVAHKIEVRLGPASDTVAALVREGAGPFDFAFIDADKSGYDIYYENCLTLVRPGGLIAIDNVLWSGHVADPKDTSPDTMALRALNKKIHADTRVDMCLIPLGDGVMLCRKR